MLWIAPIVAYITSSFILTKNIIKECFYRVELNLMLESVLLSLWNHYTNNVWGGINYFILDLFKVPILLLLYDFVFGYLHKAFHTILWEYHKVHHDDELSGFNAFNCSITEHFLLNLFPVFFVSESLFNTKEASLLWFTFATLNTVYSHHNKNSYHAFHHIHWHKHYGTSLRYFDTYNNSL